MSGSRVVSTGDGSKQLVTYSKLQQKVVRQNIKTEDEYLEQIGTIIQRDYFPDLAEMKGEAPADEVVDGSATPVLPPNQNPQKNVTSMRLDKYLANNTTEDNASFMEIMDESERKLEAKLSKFFASRSPANALTGSSTAAPLALEGPSSSSPQKAVAVTPAKEVETISLDQDSKVERITSHNTVHFNPDGAPLTAEELTQHFDRERRICPENSRFKRPLPPPDMRKLGSGAGHLKAGRFGIDGKEIVGGETPLATPQVGGFKFMDSMPASPALSSLGGATPQMTWGEVESTPFRLDEETGRTPAVSSFRLPSPSHREALAHRLADRAGRQRAKTRADAVKLAAAATRKPTSPAAALHLLSPAARRLLSASSAFGGRPNSSVSSSGAPLTPRRTPADLGVIRRPTTGKLAQKGPLTPRRGGDVGRLEAGDITKDLLNLSGSKPK